MSEAAVALPVVDCHAHVFTRDLPLVADAWTAPDYDYTPADYLAELDRHGVHFGVLSGLSISGTYNDYTVSAARDHRRLRATVIVGASIDPYALGRMNDEGVVGIRYQLVRSPRLPDLTDEAHRVLLRRVRDLDWHVHVAVEGARLAEVLAALEPSGVKIVLDHFAHPEPENGAGCTGLDAALEAVQRGRTWIKFSAGFRLAGPDAWRNENIAPAERIAAGVAERLVRQAGPERLLWGSDAPFVGYEGRMTYARALEQFARWVPDPAHRAAMSRTALRLYFG